MDAGILRDNWNANGTKKENLFSVLRDFQNATETICVEPTLLTICSVFTEGEDYLNISKTNAYMAQFTNLYKQIRSNDEERYSKALDFRSVGKKVFMGNGLTEADIKEIVQTGFYLEYGEKKKILVSQRGFPYYCRSIGKANLPKGKNPIRDLAIANSLREVDPFYITCRRHRNMSKMYYSSAMLFTFPFERMLVDIQRFPPLCDLPYFLR